MNEECGDDTVDEGVGGGGGGMHVLCGKRAE